MFPSPNWPPANCEETRVFNEENSTFYRLLVRTDRWKAFWEFALKNRNNAQSSNSLMPGVSGIAVLGLQAIFPDIPQKFPVVSLIHHLRDYQKREDGGFPNPTFTAEEIEFQLGKFAGTVEGLFSDGRANSERPF